MAIQTKTAPQRLEEKFDERDRKEIHAIVAELKAQYDERLRETTTAYNKALHELNRVAHESQRLERHLDRINAFCTKHNIETV